MPEQNLLRADHKEVDNILDQVFAALERGDQRRALARLDYFWARLAMHIRAEHLHLFPSILGVTSSCGGVEEDDTAKAPSVERTIEQLRADHNFFMSELAGAVRAMREMRDDNNGGSLRDLVEVKERIEKIGRRLITHNAIEESQVYPLVESVLSPAEAAEIHRKMKLELGNLPPRFVDDAEVER